MLTLIPITQKTQYNITCIIRRGKIKMIDQEFMERAAKTMVPFIKEEKKRKAEIHRTWVLKNPEKFKEAQKNYSQTEKGQIANRRRNSVRNQRVKELIVTLTNEELEEIRQFYANRPDGCEVDHIMPISKGGAHNIRNLQYLPTKENRKKSDHIFTESKGEMAEVCSICKKNTQALTLVCSSCYVSSKKAQKISSEYWTGRIDSVKLEEIKQKKIDKWWADVGLVRPKSDSLNWKVG